MTIQQLGEYIDAGAAQVPADIVIKNGILVNVNTSEYYPAEVAIYQRKIVADRKSVV